MKIKIITFGKIKDESIKELVEYYLKLANRYLKVEIIQLADPARKIAVVDLQKYKNGYFVYLSEKGKQFSSVEFAKYLNELKFSTS